MTAMRNEQDCERYGFLNRCSLESGISPDERTFRVTLTATWKAQTEAFYSGHDVRYVSISALDVPNADEERRAMIAYGPKVAGTDLI